VSLAEADGGIQKVLWAKLGEDQGMDLWRRFRPAYIRAFNDAKDVAKQTPIKGSKTADTDDYVTKREFRLFVCFLRYYCTWFEVFSLIDGNSAGTTAEDDRRISAEEWAGAVEKVKAVSFTWAPFVALQTVTTDTFGVIDADGKGMVLLREFSAWVKNCEIEEGTVAGERLEINEEDVKEEKEQESCNRAWRSYNDKGASGPTPEKASGQLEEFLGVYNCGEKGKAHKKARAKLWRHMDPNGNGALSLAEVDAGIRAGLWGVLGEDKGTYLWRRYRPAYIRAFNDAKDIAKQKPIPGAKADTDDYVTRREFRLLVVFLRYYSTWFEVFSLVDGGSDGTTSEDDRKVSAAEWSAGMGKVVSAGNSWAPFVALQGARDDSWAGVLHDFCAWVKQAEVEAGTPQGNQLQMGDDDEEESGR
jgi:hypothetical protein